MNCTYVHPKLASATLYRNAHCFGESENSVFQEPVHSTPSTFKDAQHPRPRLSRQEELCLAHHYLTSTYVDLSPNENDADAWRNRPFHHGLKYGFVLDAVLALTALHKSYTDPAESEKYTSACLYYQARGLREYQEHLTDINEENCHALFAFSALINALTIATSRGGPNLLPTPPLETLFTSTELVRGIRAVLDTAKETVISARYEAIFSLPRTPAGLSLTEEVSYAMHELQQRADKAAKYFGLHQLGLYTVAIESLRDHFRDVEHGKNFGAIVSWPYSVGEESIGLLRDRDAIMTLIFVHYGVLCLYIHERWWARNYGCRIIWDLSEALHALDAAWLSSTGWARTKAANPSCLYGRSGPAM